MNTLHRWLPLVLIVNLVACRPGESVPDALQRLGAGQQPKPPSQQPKPPSQRAGGVLLEFDSNANKTVHAVVLQANGKILIGGEFTTVGGANGRVRRCLARLNADGNIDTSFDAKVEGNTAAKICAILIQPDRKILIGGQYFEKVGGVACEGVARLNEDGTLDRGFNAQALRQEVRSFALQKDGKVLVASKMGAVMHLQPGRVAGAVERLNADGSLDKSFAPKINGNVHAAVLQPDGKIIIGGGFTKIGNQECRGIGRLNADGTKDGSFHSAVNGEVTAITLQPDGKVLMVGYFTTVGDMVRNYIARLNPDGSVDDNFVPDLKMQGIDGSKPGLQAVALQGNGKVVIGGGFLIPDVASCLARLTVDGKLDPTFAGNIQEGANASRSAGELFFNTQPIFVSAITMQPVGSRLIVAGKFGKVHGQPRNNVASVAGF